MIDQGDGFQRRQRRHHAEPLSRNRSIYEWTALTLVSVSSIFGPWLFGAARPWISLPMMLLVFIGVGMTALRPFVFREVRQVQYPAGMALALGFVLYAFVLMFFAAVPYEARIEVLRVASYAGALWVWCELASHKGRWRWLIGLLLLAVTVMAWYAIIQHARDTRMVLFMERPAQYEMRASGAYICPNHFANYLEMALPICLALVVCPHAGIIMRLLAGYGLLVILPALYLTISRSGYIGAFVGLTVTACLIAARRGVRHLMVVLLLALAVGAGAALALWHFSPSAQARIAQTLQGDTRIQLWKDTLNMIVDKPLLGHGPGSYRWVYPHYWHHMTMYLDPEYAHNDYLHAAAEYGAVGLLLILVTALVMIGWLIRSGSVAERRKDALLAAGVVGSVAACMAHALFDFSFQLYGNNHVLVMLLGVATAGFYASGMMKGIEIGSARRLMAIVGAALASLLFITTLRAYLSYGLNHLGEKAREVFKPEVARSRYVAAMRVDQGNWRPYRGLAHMRRAQSFWNLDAEAKRAQSEEAFRYYKEAMRRNRWDMESIYGLARLHAAMGEQDQALALLQQIVERVPYQRFYLSELGLQLRRMGRYREALDAFQRARAIQSTELIEINIQLLEQKLAEGGA